MSSPSTSRTNLRISGGAAAVLRTGRNTGGTVTTSAGTTNTAGGTVPPWATGVFFYANQPFRVAIGEATSGSVGIPFNLGNGYLDVEPAGGTLNFQTLGAAGTIHYGFTRGR